MTPRVHREWSNRVAAEYRSAAITAQVLHWLISVGADDALVSTCMRIVRDELDHAQLSHDCLVALGGGGQAVVRRFALVEGAALERPVGDVDPAQRRLGLGVERSGCR